MAVIDLGQLRREEVERVADRRSLGRRVRSELISKLAAEVGYPIICYVTAGRAQLGAQIGRDVIRFFREHLDLIGSRNRSLGLYLITRGGDTLAPSRLVALLRENCQKLIVLVPYMAHSAGTLIALGADEILMGPMAELGPVDPTVGNQFNPVLDTGDAPGGKLPTPRPRIPISVEDVTAYLALAKEKAGLGSGQSMVEAFKALTDRIHPIALGNIHRQHMLIRRLARRLLRMHMDHERERDRIELITETLTEKLYAHAYVITREEAKNEMNLKVEYPSQLIESLMWSLYQAYEKELFLDQEFDFGTLLGNRPKAYAILDVGMIEGGTRLDVYSYQGWLGKKGQEEINLDVERASWEQVLSLEKST